MNFTRSFLKTTYVLLLLAIAFGISAQEENLDQLLKKGIKEYDDDNFKEAILTLNQVLEKDPRNETAYYTRARAFHEMKQYVLSINDFSKTIELNPKHQKAYYNRGYTRYLIQNYRGAIDDFNIAIELNPNSALSYAYRGNCRFALGDKKEACEDWVKATDMGYFNAQDLINLNCQGIISSSGQEGADKLIMDGDIKFSSKDYAGAIADYNKALKVNPKSGYAYLGIGMVKYVTGDNANACIAWKEAVKLGNYESQTFIDQHCK